MCVNQTLSHIKSSKNSTLISIQETETSGERVPQALQRASLIVLPFALNHHAIKFPLGYYIQDEG